MEVSQHGEEKAPETPWSIFQYLVGVYQKAGEGHFTRTGNDRIEGNGLKLNKGRFRHRYHEKILYNEGSEVLKDFVQL